MEPTQQIQPRFDRSDEPKYPQSIFNPLEGNYLGRAWECLTNTCYYINPYRTLSRLTSLVHNSDGSYNTVVRVNHLGSSVILLTHPLALHALWQGENRNDPKSKILDARNLKAGVEQMGFSIALAGPEDHKELRKLYKETSNSPKYLNTKQPFINQCALQYTQQIDELNTKTNPSSLFLSVLEHYSTRVLAASVINSHLTSEEWLSNERVEKINQAIKSLNLGLRMTFFGVPQIFTAGPAAAARKILREAGLEVDKPDLNDPDNKRFAYQVKAKVEEKKLSFNLEQAEALIGNAFLAGQEPIASLIYNIIYILGRNIPIQERLRNEWQGLSDEELTDYLASNDNYLDNLVKEGQRLFPAAYLTTRTVKEQETKAGKVYINDHRAKTSIEFDGNTQILVGIYYTNTNPDVWGKDAHEFNPDRFIKNETLKQSQYLATFGGNTPNNCAGEKLAVRATKTFIYHFLTKFEIDADENTSGFFAGSSLYPNEPYRFYFSHNLKSE